MDAAAARVLRIPDRKPFNVAEIFDPLKQMIKREILTIDAAEAAIAQPILPRDSESLHARIALVATAKKAAMMGSLIFFSAK
jgi:hypothetical protein